MAGGWRHLLDVFFVVLITTAINTLFIGWFNQQPPSQTQRVPASSSSTPAPSELSSTPSPSVTPPATVPVVHRAVVGTRPQQTTKTKKPFYLVASPESNGNRFVVKLLVAAGCYGISGHEQPFDQKQRGGGGDWPNHFRSAHVSAGCAVMHRSVPHATTWPNIPSLVQQIAAAGFQPRLLVVLRPEDAARESQVKQKHVRTVSDAQANILRAQRHIVDALASMPDVWFRLVLYEQLGHEHYLHWLFAEQMGLSLPESHPKFEDRDSKHFH